MKDFQNYFKEHRKTPPEHLWKSISGQVNLIDPKKIRRRGMAKKSKLAFVFSFAAIVIIAIGTVLFFQSKSIKKAGVIPQKAYVTFLMGHAEMETPDGNIIKLKVGKEVTGARVLRTKDKSRIDVRLTSGSLFTINENSEMKLMAYLSSKSKQEKTNINLFKGKLVVEPNKVKEDGNFDVNTPTAVAGVRGTRFSISYNQQDEATRVAVERGKVQVRRKINVDVDKNMKTKIIKAIQAETVVDKGQSVVVTRASNEKISEELNKDIDKIQTRIAQNKQIEAIGAINKAKQLANIKSQGLTTEDKNLFSQTKTYRDPVGSVKVAISNQGGVLFINGTETNTPEYNGEFKPGAEIKVRIEKRGYHTYNSTFTVPGGVKSYRPEIKLIRMTANKPVYVTVTRSKEITLKRVANTFNTKYKPTSFILEKNNVVYFATSAGKFVAVDMAKQGELQWEIAVNASLDSTPVIQGNTIYFGARNSIVYAVDIANGQVKWKKRLGTMIFKSSMIVKSTRLYFGTIEGNVYCLNADSGATIWKKHLDGGIWGSVAVGNSIVYAGCEDGKLYALDRNSGLQKWAVDLENRLIAPVLITNRRVLAVNYRGKIFGIKSDNGKIIWKKDFKSSRINPVIFGSNVYFSIKNKIYSLNVGNGEEIFTKDLAGNNIHIQIQNRRLFISGGGNSIYEFSAAGQMIWTHKLKQKVFGLLAGNNEYIFAISKDGKLLKIRRRTKVKKAYKVRVLRGSGR